MITEVLGGTGKPFSLEVTIKLATPREFAHERSHKIIATSLKALRLV